MASPTSSELIIHRALYGKLDVTSILASRILRDASDRDVLIIPARELRSSVGLELPCPGAPVAVASRVNSNAAKNSSDGPTINGPHSSNSRSHNGSGSGSGNSNSNPLDNNKNATPQDPVNTLSILFEYPNSSVGKILAVTHDGGPDLRICWDMPLGTSFVASVEEVGVERLRRRLREEAQQGASRGMDGTRRDSGASFGSGTTVTGHKTRLGVSHDSSTTRAKVIAASWAGRVVRAEGVYEMLMGSVGRREAVEVGGGLFEVEEDGDGTAMGRGMGTLHVFCERGRDVFGVGGYEGDGNVWVVA